jgi:hypothetical protein
MWSLPVGLLGWLWLQRYVPSFLTAQWMFDLARIAAVLLAPLVTVCSSNATRRCITNREGYNRFTIAILVVFNYLTAIVAGFTTVWLFVALLRWLVDTLFFQ